MVSLHVNHHDSPGKDRLMRYDSFQEKYLISQGMIHMAYRAESIYDIICHYSAEGYELLDGAFVAFIDEIMPHLPKNLPVVLEISGCKLTQAEERRIEEAIEHHYRIRLAGIEHQNHRNLVRMSWFVISFLLSAILLFQVGENTDFLLTQFAYVPFWFFGYRILASLNLDLMPYLRQRHACRQIVTMKVMFSGPEIRNEIPPEEAEAYQAAIRQNYEKLKKRKNESTAEDSSDSTWNIYADYKSLIRHFLIDEDGRPHILCRVQNLHDVVRDSSVAGYEMLQDEFAAYLDQALPYIPDPTGLILEFLPVDADAWQHPCDPVLQRAVRTWLAYRQEDARREEIHSRRKILFFAISLLLSMGFVLLGQYSLDKATFEFVTMLFWFFADYLIEFILLEYTAARHKLKDRKKLQQLEIR